MPQVQMSTEMQRIRCLSHGWERVRAELLWLENEERLGDRDPHRVGACSLHCARRARRVQRASQSPATPPTTRLRHTLILVAHLQHGYC